ncbi:triose-phosphate isomerase [soil metagenome]
MSRGMPFVLGNWKMNPAAVRDAVDLARAARGAERALVEVGIAPPSVALEEVARALRGSAVRVFAQDVHWEEKGAYTGQIAASMLRGIADGAIVGHSEVRRDQGDDDLRVSRKVARALAAALRVVLCVGEGESEFAEGRTEAVLARQVAADVAGCTDAAGRAALHAARLVVAYEPVWAIGTGRPATGAHAAAAARTIRAALSEAGGDGDATQVLYGGSVTVATVGEFAAAEGIDGTLVGGASLDPEEFAAIVRSFG